MPKQTEELAIQVKHLSKSFRLPHNRQNSIKGSLINLLGRGDRTYETQEVLKDVSFDIKKGEFFGIVGRNGSGKSTLLKLIAGIYTPTKGGIQINGTLTPFIELGVGFNPDLTGRENVYLNGALLGFDKEHVEKMYESIVEFAELGRFMDQKLKNYSSGMQVRLAFSIAIRARSDILLLDEVLAVGDEAFQKKCYTYFSDLKANKQTVILVTHDMGAVERYCNRALLLEKGKVKMIGSSVEVAGAYRELFLDDKVASEYNHEIKKTDIIENVLVTVRPTKSSGGIVGIRDPFDISITYTANQEVGQGSVGVSVVNSAGVTVLAVGTGTIYDDAYEIHNNKNTLTFSVEENLFTQDKYTINIGIAKGPQDGIQEYIYQELACASFVIKGKVARPHSLMQPRVVTTVGKS